MASQSVRGVGLRGSPKVCRCARAPVAIRPLHAKTPYPSLRPPLPESLGSGGVPGVASKWPVGRGGEASRPKATIGRCGG